MARQRSTWKTDRQAASSRTADVYTMNQDHPQPSPVDYENGDPDSWAETPTNNGNVTKTYDGDSEARDEVGFGKFAPDTWDHKGTGPWGDSSGKYENQKPINASSRKAIAAERVASALLRTANTELIEQQALDLMGMPDKLLIATLQRLDKVSPDSLDKEAKLRRSYACCKLAADVLPAKEAFTTEEAWSQSVQKMASTFMTIDSPTLKTLIRQAAEAKKHLAAEDDDEAEEDDDDGQTAAAPVATEEEACDDTAATAAPAAPVAPVAKEPLVIPETAGGDDMSMDEPEEDVSCMTPGDAAMLDSMTQEGPAVPAAPAPLTDLFGGAPMMGEPMVEMPAVASSPLDISFDDEDDGRTASALPDGSDLDNVFGDHEEVVAQREIMAAEAEQARREFGYAPDVRTASSGGAKKLGQVTRNQKPTNDLDGLWS